MAISHHNRLRPASALVLLVSVATSSCTVGPDFHPPQPPATRTYVASEPTVIQPPIAGEPGQTITIGAPLRSDWWTLLCSPEINQTVALALANNNTLAMARSKLRAAAQDVAAVRGRQQPQVDLAGGIEDQKYGSYFLGPLAFTFPRFTSYTGGAQISYDLDVFGGTRRAVEQSRAEAEVEQRQLDAARLEIAGAVVIQALQIAALRAQVQVIDGIVDSDRKTMDLVTTAQRVGVATRIDITTTRSQLDRDRALLPPIRQQIDVAASTLAVLVGKAPADWKAPDFDLARITLPRQVPLIVPSSLVRSRPDIRAAEANLHAANAAVGVATADLYPRLNLSAELAGQGLASGGFGSAWSVIGGLTAPVFHGGTLTARKRAAVAQRDASFSQYQQTVLTAFEQVADALHGLSNTSDAIAAQEQALASAGEALELTRHGFADGSIGIVQVLDAQRLQQLAEIDLVQAGAQRYVQTVNVFLAMGGGVEAPTKAQ